jgi:hypothetical protein
LFNTAIFLKLCSFSYCVNREVFTPAALWYHAAAAPNERTPIQTLLFDWFDLLMLGNKITLILSLSQG